MDRYWPERFTLMIGAVILAVLLFLGSGSPTAGSDAWFSAFADIVFTLGVKVLLPSWLVFRVFDTLFLAARRKPPLVTVLPEEPRRR